MKQYHRALLNAVIAVVLIMMAITTSLIFIICGFGLLDGNRLFGLPVETILAITVLIYIALIFYKIQLRTLSTAIIACIVCFTSGYLVYYAIIKVVALFICSLYECVYSSIPFM